jgi:hypothetical protein
MAKTESTLGSTLALEIKKDFALADELLREIVVAGRKPSFEELTVFQSRVGWDAKAVAQQLGRMANVVRFQAICGTKKNREDAKTEMERSEQVLATRGVEIQTQIENLQSQLRSLENDARLSRKRLEDMEDAAIRLRDQVPAHIKNEHNAKNAAISESLGRAFLDAEGELRFLDAITDPSKFRDRFAYAETVSMHYPGHIMRDDRGHKLVAPSWEAERLKLQEQADQLRTRVPELKEAFDKAEAEAKKTLDVYLK